MAENQVNEQEKAEYIQLQRRFAKNRGLKKGSKVTLLQAFTSNQSGFPDVFADHIQIYVGQTGTCLYAVDNSPASDAHGILVEFDDAIVCNLPFFCLSVENDAKD